MDYKFWAKRLLEVNPELLDELTQLALSTTSASIPRFNYPVRGFVAGDNQTLDNKVRQLQEQLSSSPELRDTIWGRYHAVHWVEPGSSLHEHTDVSNGESFDDFWYHKIHVPLVTNEQAQFHFRRNLNDPLETFHLQRGYAYLFNTVAFHGVSNEGPARAHLILYAADKAATLHFKKTKLWGNSKCPKAWER